MLFRSFSFIFSLIFTISAVNAIGAGVLPFFDDGTVLLGREPRHGGHVWSDFGGKPDKNESLARAAFREFKEETAHYTFSKITLAQVQNAPYVDLITGAGFSYRTYLLRIHGPKPTIQSIHKNAVAAKKKLGNKAHVEKNDWKYFNAQVIMNAHNQNGNLPGTNEPLFGPMKGSIRNPNAQAFFNHFINSVKNAPKVKKPVQVKKAVVKQKRAANLNRRAVVKQKRAANLNKKRVLAKQRRAAKLKRRAILRKRFALKRRRSR